MRCEVTGNQRLQNAEQSSNAGQVRNLAFYSPPPPRDDAVYLYSAAQRLWYVPGNMIVKGINDLEMLPIILDHHTITGMSRPSNSYGYHQGAHQLQRFRLTCGDIINWQKIGIVRTDSIVEGGTC